MAIFISYSRKDSAFVDNLALNLVRQRHDVWLDKWIGVDNWIDPLYYADNNIKRCVDHMNSVLREPK